MNIFKEKDGTFSWRKALTASAMLIFAFACIGFLLAHGFEELPKTYQGIIGGVFAFYFGKNIFNIISITKTPDQAAKKNNAHIDS